MPTTETRNLLLLNLSPEARKAILNVSENVHLGLRDNCIEPLKPIEYVDFPEMGVISVLTPMEDGTLVEIANIGKEGMVGVSVVMGVMSISEIAFCQVEGSTLRVKTSDFLPLVKKYPEIASMCQRYAITLFDQVARNAGCNRIHTIEKRCARWLLLTHDRCDKNQFVLTQEFLALMLGVSRTGVNIAAGVLAKANLITYVRGKMTILDRPGLEAASCECYTALGNYFEKTMSFETI